MRAGVYVRVSTDRQDTANQMPALLELCAARGWEADVRSEVESGAKRRPVLEALCSDAKRGKVGAVVVWALDRLGRHKVEAAHRARDLGHAGVRLVSYQETWVDQPPGPTRDLLIDVFTWVAQQERDRLIARTREGLAKAAAKGRHPGRPRVDSAAMAQAIADVRDGKAVRSAAAEWRVSEATLRRRVKK